MADFNFYLNRQGIQGKKGEKGDQGFSPVISEGQNTSDTYTLNITNEFETFETPNLRGNFVITDNGGKYVMYNSEDQTLEANNPIPATDTSYGVVRLATTDDLDVNTDEDRIAIGAKVLRDALPIYLTSPDNSVVINQNPDTELTELTVNSSIEGDIAQERAERIAADADLQNKITSEESNRIAADGVLGRNISNVASDLETEKQIRLAADTQQQQLIDAERQERETQDASLQSQLSTKLTIDNIKAGNNITINKVGNNITINSTGGGGGGGDNCMTTDTNQTVTGEKIFMNDTLQIGNDSAYKVLAEFSDEDHYTDPEHSKSFLAATVLKGSVISEGILYKPEAIINPDLSVIKYYSPVLAEADVDNQTIKVVDGKLHADFSEIGDEVNTLAGRMNTVENELGDLTERVDDLSLFKFPNVTIIGEPTINNGQISNFSMNNYLQFPFEFETKGRTWLLNGSFHTGSNVTTQQNIIDSLASIALAVRGGRLVLALSTNGTTFDLGEHISMSNIEPNTTYFFRITFSGIAYTLSLSTDKIDYMPEAIVESSIPIASTTMTISSTGHPYSDIINLNDWDLTVANLLVWQGMDDVGISSRLDVNGSNITKTGIEHLKEVLGIAGIETLLNEILGNEEAISSLVDEINVAYNTDSTPTASVMMLSLEPNELDVENSFTSDKARAVVDDNLDLPKNSVESYEDDDTDLDLGGNA